MQFYIDSDTGSCINGWLVPDNPGNDVALILRVPERPAQTIRANILRSDVVALGMHPTGMVGFQIDDNIIPGVSEISEISIADAQSGLTIYRRTDHTIHLSQKILFFMIGGMPPFKILRRCAQRFALSYPMVERLPFETIYSLFGGQVSKSVTIFGQINWQRLGNLVRDNKFTVFALLRDPFEELAERLLFLSLLSKRVDNQVSGDLFVRNRPLMPLTAFIESADTKKLLSALRDLEPPQKRLLRSPVTSALACMPDEEPQRRHVSMALEQLARFDAIGIRSHFGAFASLADSIIGEPILTDIPELDSLPGTAELAARLAGMGLIEDLLDEDLALYSFVREALAAGYRAELPDSLPPDARQEVAT